MDANAIGQRAAAPTVCRERGRCGRRYAGWNIGDSSSGVIAVGP